MASEKAAQILRKREAPFTEQEIAMMSERDAWGWILANDRAAREMKAQTKLPQVCFTSFTDSQRIRLQEIASKIGFKTKDSVTKTLVILVTGENAGPSKVKKAQAQGCIITDETGFMNYVRNKNEF